MPEPDRGGGVEAEVHIGVKENRSFNGVDLELELDARQDLAGQGQSHPMDGEPAQAGLLRNILHLAVAAQRQGNRQGQRNRGFGILRAQAGGGEKNGRKRQNRGFCAARS